MGELIENRYRVLSVVGSGGMGTLYRVSDEAHLDGAREEEVVALKTVILEGSAAESPESVGRFQREFQILTQLHHPNLVSVYSYGITTEGELYFTMEWVEGRDLEPSLRPLEPGATVSVMVQVCRALAYLHARGVIHGDLKPRNVLMAADGGDADDAGHAGDRRHRVKLVDFGLAREIRSPEEQARYYTPGYAAPEIAQRRPLDHRADLYSLGAMWYALLVGEPPTFMFGSERLIRFTLREVLEAQTRIPGEIGAVIARLLATSPDERYDSANEVIVAVNNITGSAYALETRETVSSYALRTRFVDRETEMEVLQTLWKQTQAGEGGLVLISGEAGVGKTRLVEELEVQAELEGTRVVWGQCVESGGSAYRPWGEVLRVLMRYVEGAEGTGLEMERVGPVVAALLPELWEREYMAGLAPPAELELQAAQQRLHDGIGYVLRAAAGLRSTVIVIEDAHWADEATLALLSFLTRASEWAGLLVCVTFRSDEVGPEHPLVSLAGERVQCIPMQSLSPEVTTDLVRSMLGLEELPTLLAERVQQTTGGNAFFVQELIRSLAAEGEVLRRTVGGWQVDHTALQEAQLPESIRQVIWRRLAQLSEETRQVLRWAAVIGLVFWEGVLEDIGQAPRAQVRAALREGKEQGLVMERDESAFAGEREYLFNSPTVREVSYESIPQDGRREAHGRAAAWLMAHSDEERGEHLGLIADQLEGAGQTEGAVTYLRLAGEQAAARFTNAEAVAYFSRALDMTPADEQVNRYNLLLAREKVYHLQGAREAQAQDLATLKELAEALADDRRRTEVSLRQANYAEATGDYPAAIAAAREAIHLAQTIQDVSSEATGYRRWGEVLWNRGDYKAAQPQLEQSLVLARAAGVREVEAGSLRDLGVVFWFQGNYAEARVHFEQSLHIYREMEDRQEECGALNNLGIVSVSQGDYVGARAYYEQSLHLSREIGNRRNEGTVLNNIGEILRYQGDYVGARDRLTQALRIGQDVGDRTNQGYILTNMGHTLVGLEHWAEAADAYQQALALRQGLGQSSLAMDALAGLAHVSLTQGDLNQAQARVEEVLRYDESNTLDGAEDPFRIYLMLPRFAR